MNVSDILQHKTVRIILILGAMGTLLVGGFVGYNLWQDRNVEKVEQTNAPSFEELVEAEQQPEEATTEEATERLQESASRSGDFTGMNGYQVAGGVKIVEQDGEQLLVFDESFSTSNGPDLIIYLSPNNVEAGESLGEFVSLGGLKEVSGGQVYSLPENVEDFNSVVIWCRAFSVEFGSADLS